MNNMNIWMLIVDREDDHIAIGSAIQLLEPIIQKTIWVRVLNGSVFQQCVGGSQSVTRSPIGLSGDGYTQHFCAITISCFQKKSEHNTRSHHEMMSSFFTIVSDIMTLGKVSRCI